MKKSFYTLSFTWGIVMTIIGLIAAVALIATGHRPHRWGWCIYFVSKSRKNWGGVSLGIVFITDKRDSASNKNHEFGHSLQNCKYGPLMPFLSLFSAGRYWYRKIRRKKGLKNTTDYDAFWFEGEATELGNKYKIY